MNKHTLKWAALAVALLAPQVARAEDDLDDLFEKAVKNAVAKAAPFVVKIETSGGTEIVRSGGPRGRAMRRGSGPTTGVIVTPDGYVISSSFNFANKPTTIRVSLPGTKERKVARVVATDNVRMLTLLKMADLPAGTKLPVPTAVPRADMTIGMSALAVGRTLNAETDDMPSVSVGILSAIDRVWGRAVQTDAKVSPTNYGGPLIDLTGRVYGVLVPVSPQAEGELAGVEWYDSGIGFGIPMADIFAVLPRMMKGTEKEPVVLQPGFLGVTMQSGNEMFERKPVLGTIQPGSAADKAGLKPGDTITAIGGKAIANFAQMRHQLGARYEGDEVSLSVDRGGKEVKVEKLVLGSAVAAFNQPFLGILPMRDDPEAGVEVRYVYPKSGADVAGIKEGDRILKVSRPDLPPAIPPMVINRGRNQLMDLLAPGRPGQDIKVEVKRKAGGKVETLTVKLGEVPETVPAKLPERATAKKALTPPGGKPPAVAPKKPETGLQKLTLAATGQDYWVYIPDGYDPNVACSILVWLHPPGKNKERDFEDISSSWATYCDDHNIIMVCPPSDNPRGWTPAEADFVAQTVRTVATTYTVDMRRVVVHGLGIGGEMAYYLGFNKRDMIRGVATVGAPLTHQLRERVTNQPLSFFVVVGDKDTSAGAVKETETRLKGHKYPVMLREIKNMGHEYIDGKLGVPTLEELVRWLDSLDRM